jgi:hypothetical protein
VSGPLEAGQIVRVFCRSDADQGFLLGGAWHAVPDAEVTPDAED